jgi:acetyl-CoA acetyltransferase
MLEDPIILKMTNPYARTTKEIHKLRPAFKKRRFRHRRNLAVWMMVQQQQLYGQSEDAVKKYGLKPMASKY